MQGRNTEPTTSSWQAVENAKLLHYTLLQGNIVHPVYYDSLFRPIIDRDWWWVHMSVHVRACEFLPGKPRLWIDQDSRLPDSNGMIAESSFRYAAVGNSRISSRISSTKEATFLG